MPDPARVRDMFARIAGRYDLLNRVLSLGLDQRWRSRAVQRAGDVRGSIVVDACCGTGDLSLAFAEAGAKVVGVDFTPEMLELAAPKRRAGSPSALFAQGDCLRLPLRSRTAAVCSAAFGVRNLADPDAGLVEMARVVKRGGRVLVLEFTTPEGAILSRLYRFYFTRILPRIGRLVSRDGDAYSYLPRTVLAWPSPEEFQVRLEQAGLVDCGFQRMTRGIACLHWGSVPSGSDGP